MNREDIIRMADKARFEIVRGDGWPDEQLIHKLERFAALVASAEREYLRESFRVVTAAEASAAILHEREACAKLCEELKITGLMLDAYSCNDARNKCAEAIRARRQA